MKNKIRKIMAAVLVTALMVCMVPVSVFASGSYYVSASSLVITLGYSGGFSFGATDAVGFFTIDTDGGITASCSDDLFVDDSSVYITVTGSTVGTGHVYITVYDGTDYDGNDLSGKSYTVTVTVREDATTAATTESTTTTQETTTKSSTTKSTTTKATTSQSTTTKSTTSQTTTTKETTTKETTTTEETTTEDETTEELTEEELLTVVINNASYTVLKDISEITVPSGFTVEEVEYNTVTVEAMVLDDYVIYILEGNVTGRTGYYFYDEDEDEFEKVRYTTVGSDMCIFLDMPDDLEIPYGYSLVEVDMYGYTVEALALDEEAISEAQEAEEELSAEETASESAIEIKSFDTVGASMVILYDDDDASAGDDGTEGYTDPILGDVSVTTVDDLVDSAEGHYYVYCLWDGEEVLCDYDSEKNSLSKCTALLVIEEPAAEDEDTDVEETSGGLFSIPSFWLIIIAILVIAAVVVVIINVLLLKRKKNAKGTHRGYDDKPEEEDFPLEEEILFEEPEHVDDKNDDDDDEYERLLRRSAEKLKTKYSKEPSYEALETNDAEDVVERSAVKTVTEQKAEPEKRPGVEAASAFAEVEPEFAEVESTASSNAREESVAEAPTERGAAAAEKPSKTEKTSPKPEPAGEDAVDLDDLFEEEELDISEEPQRSGTAPRKTGVEDITAVLTEEFEDMLKELKGNEEE